jgi:uncharacterized membrane protein
MNATSLPVSWGTSPDRRAVPWVFGREVALREDDGCEAGRALQWLLRRNCSISPRQMGAVYVSLCALSLAIASFFLFHGAPVVMAFAGVELLVVGIALLVYARHAGDRETLTLSGRRLRVEQRFGPRVDRTDFTAEWLTVEPALGQGSLVQLSGEGRTVKVGRHLRPELRAAFARELRTALRRVPPARG